MAEAQRKVRGEAPLSKVLEDRVQADGEMVGQVLDPGRTSETVRYPDPRAPGPDENATGIDSVAEVEMARRTDAGRREAAPAAGWASGSPLMWFAVVVVALGLLALVAI